LRYLNCIIGAYASKGEKLAVFTVFCTVVILVYEQRFHNGSQAKHQKIATFLDSNLIT
jgi:hypothetical protein